MTAAEMFRRHYNGNKNFMTPDVIYRRKLTEIHAVELSSGSGFGDNTIYGVTILEHNPVDNVITSRHDLSQACHSRAEADDYINAVRDRLRA